MHSSEHSSECLKNMHFGEHFSLHQENLLPKEYALIRTTLQLMPRKNKNLLEQHCCFTPEEYVSIKTALKFLPK
jgi:hypothetical protein